ncbi:hypothetical protein D3C84_1240230 [compost metagenome]
MNGTSAAARWTMNRFIPSGGVTKPISTTISARMPNQIDFEDSSRPKKSRPMITG